MKKLTKVLSLVLALALVLMSVNIVAVQANANRRVTLTIHGNDTGRTYTAYQLFKGTGIDPDGSDVDETTGHILSNIAYGSATSGHITDFLTAIKDSNTSLSGKTYTLSTPASEVAKDIATLSIEDDSREAGNLANAIATYLTSAGASGTASISAGGNDYTISDLEEGYYIIVDTTVPGAHGISPALLRLIGGVGAGKDTAEYTVKDDDPSAVKTVDYTTSTGGSFSIGDAVPFKVSVHVPEDVTLYEKFDFKLTDTLEGLHFEQDKLDFKVYRTTGKGATEDTSTDLSEDDHFKATITPDNNKELVITHKNVSSEPDHWDDYAGETVNFYYKAVLDSSALIGNNDTLDRSQNKVVLNYTNDPHEGSTNTDALEQTADVYSVGLEIDKVDQDSNALDGAGFTLAKWSVGDGEFQNVTDKVTSSGTDTSSGNDRFDFAGLGDGWYKLTESTVPNGYDTWGPKILHIETVPNGDTGLTSYTVTAYNDSPTFSGGSSGLTGADVSLFTADPTTGVAKATIQNNRGINLPETGGMGTKIFYTLGGVLVVGAVVLLVVKRRMRAE